MPLRKKSSPPTFRQKALEFVQLAVARLESVGVDMGGMPGFEPGLPTRPHHTHG